MENLNPLLGVEPLYGPHEADLALLDQVEQRNARAGVALGQGDDEAEVGLDEDLAGPQPFLNLASKSARRSGSRGAARASSSAAAVPNRTVWPSLASSSFVSRGCLPMSSR